MMTKNEMFDKLFEHPYVCGDVDVCGECDRYTDDPQRDMSHKIMGLCKSCARKMKAKEVPDDRH